MYHIIHQRSHLQSRSHCVVSPLPNSKTKGRSQSLSITSSIPTKSATTTRPPVSKRSETILPLLPSYQRGTIPTPTIHHPPFFSTHSCPSQINLHSRRRCRCRCRCRYYRCWYRYRYSRKRSSNHNSRRGGATEFETDELLVE